MYSTLLFMDYSKERFSVWHSVTLGIRAYALSVISVPFGHKVS